MLEENTINHHKMNNHPTTPQHFSINLRQIADWDLDHLDGASHKIKASVPALQRGLVWNPHQVELLWDSILRGFPIGCLVVSKKLDSQERSGKEGVTHHLLDGQQRCNAITLGFHDPFADSRVELRGNVSESILWLDLAPMGTKSSPYVQFDRNSTREFLVRVTTLAHPWGYSRSDDAKRIAADEAREAIDFEYSEQPKLRPHPNELLPWFSNAPVPLAWLMNSIVNGDAICEQKEFWEAVSSKLEMMADKKKWPSLALEFLRQPESTYELEKIYQAVLRAAQTHLVVMEVLPDMLGKTRQEMIRTDHNAPEISNIEHLFTRLNSKGTRLDGEELAYSMIKAYWPKVADVIDSVIPRRFPSSQLVSLGVRAALTAQGDTKLARPLGISRLRAITDSISSDKGDRENDAYSQRMRIEEFFGIGKSASAQSDNRRLARACQRVDEWLVFSENSHHGLPPVLVSSFARRSSDIYLFLVHIADQLRYSDPALDTEWKKLAPGLATLTHWFSVEGQNSAIADILMQSIACAITPECVHKGLSHIMEKKLLVVPHHPDYLESHIMFPDEAGMKLDRWWELNAGEYTESEVSDRKESLGSFLGRVLWQREILLYGQREYLGVRFADYDPSRKDLWESHNRPWDFDHIHASAFFYNRSGDYANFCRSWGNTIGNLRAWPFEENRSDQKASAKKKLLDKPDDMVASLIETVQELDAFSYENESRHQAEKAISFGCAVKARFCRIYRNWYESAKIDFLLKSEPFIDTTTL